MYSVSVCEVRLVRVCACAYICSWKETSVCGRAQHYYLVADVWCRPVVATCDGTWYDLILLLIRNFLSRCSCYLQCYWPTPIAQSIFNKVLNKISVCNMFPSSWWSNNQLSTQKYQLILGLYSVYRRKQKGSEISDQTPSQYNFKELIHAMNSSHINLR